MHLFVSNSVLYYLFWLCHVDPDALAGVVPAVPALLLHHAQLHRIIILHLCTRTKGVKVRSLHSILAAGNEL